MFLSWLCSAVIRTIKVFVFNCTTPPTSFPSLTSCFAHINQSQSEQNLWQTFCTKNTVLKLLRNDTMQINRLKIKLAFVFATQWRKNKRQKIPLYHIYKICDVHLEKGLCHILVLDRQNCLLHNWTEVMLFVLHKNFCFWTDN